MKVWVWGVFALLALLWTLGVWAATAALHWGLQWLASAPQLDAAGAIGALGVPAWLTLWVDLSLLQALLESVRRALELAQQGGPMLAALWQALIGWMVPLAWLAWGLGMLILLALAGSVHWLLGRIGRPGGGTPPGQPGLGGAPAA